MKEEAMRAEEERRLIEQYAYLVKYVVDRTGAGASSAMDRDDLYQYGIIGLLNAIRTFDPSKGVPFEIYAMAKIKAHIIDAIRKNNPMPRPLRQKLAEIKRVCEQLYTTLGRPPTDEEIAEAVGISVAKLNKILATAACYEEVSLEEILQGEDGTCWPWEERLLGSANPPSPVDLFELQEQRRLLAEAISALPERERQVLSLYYYEGLTLKEIARLLKVTESRVSQLHTKALLRLRHRLKELGYVIRGRRGDVEEVRGDAL
ncbi:MAG TPA: FliA/WhiG family RNA polymerase sigma factor [Armatimonadetes bacterium]|nr:FliA/WhiG family RNA polymerase sigma factor [Armatimonadota bacterium]